MAKIERLTTRTINSASQWDDWTDHEIVTMNFMLWLYEVYPIDTTFTMHPYDLSRFLGTQSVANNHHQLENIRRIFRIGVFTDEVLTIQMREEHQEINRVDGRKKRSGQIYGCRYESAVISDISAMLLHTYLMGRAATEKQHDLITKEILPHSGIPYPYYWTMYSQPGK